MMGGGHMQGHSLNFNLKGKQVFSRLGLVKGCCQVLIHMNSWAKTAVVTPLGNYQFYFMPFGHKNAGVNGEVIDFVFVYLCR